MKLKECTKIVLRYLQSKALLKQLKASHFAWFHDEFSSSRESIFLLYPTSFILVPFICWAPSDRLTLLCIALSKRLLHNVTLCRLWIYSVFTQIGSSHKTSFMSDRSVQNWPKWCSFFLLFSLAWGEITKLWGSKQHCSTCSCLCVSQPLYVGGNHRDIPLDVWNKDGTLLMATMHQLIVFFCGLVSHSSSAFVVIFLSEFTLEQQCLF